MVGDSMQFRDYRPRRRTRDSRHEFGSDSRLELYENGATGRGATTITPKLALAASAKAWCAGSIADVGPAMALVCERGSLSRPRSLLLPSQPIASVRDSSFVQVDELLERFLHRRRSPFAPHALLRGPHRFTSGELGRLRFCDLA